MKRFDPRETRPGRRAVAAFNRVSAVDPRRKAKSMLGRLLFASGRYRSAFEGRALVTCFHSVASNGSALSCTAQEFAAYCDFLKRYFDVIDLGELLDRLESGASVGGAAVITFDDGYLDNATVAAPILQARGLPATFFLATGFIGTKHQAWWDAEAGVTSEWMSWEHAVTLRDAGFSIGAHTRNHVDLGSVSAEVATAEVIASVADISAALGEAPTLFAYPFGGRDNITDDVRDAVRAAGLRCCPSSFGGLVTGASDPYTLRRVPVTTWYQSPYQLGFEVARSGEDHVVGESPVSSPQGAE